MINKLLKALPAAMCLLGTSNAADNKKLRMIIFNDFHVDPNYDGSNLNTI